MAVIGESFGCKKQKPPVAGLAGGGRNAGRTIARVGAGWRETGRIEGRPPAARQAGVSQCGMGHNPFGRCERENSRAPSVSIRVSEGKRAPMSRFREGKNHAGKQSILG